MRTALRWAVRGSATVAALLATVQPVLGSFAFFRPSGTVDYGTVHLVVGATMYNLALVLALLAPFTGFRRRWTLFAACLALYGLTHLQLRLGLGARDDAGLLAYHVPVGVAILALSYLAAALSFGLRLTSPRHDAPAVADRVSDHTGGALTEE